MASCGVPARARGPTRATSGFRLSGLRDENKTSCPAHASSSPTVPPIFPDPMNPIFIGRVVWGVDCAAVVDVRAIARAVSNPRLRRGDVFVAIAGDSSAEPPATGQGNLRHAGLPRAHARGRPEHYLHVPVTTFTASTRTIGGRNTFGSPAAPPAAGGGCCTAPVTSTFL